jgi:hypothetical protein
MDHSAVKKPNRHVRRAAAALGVDPAGFDGVFDTAEAAAYLGLRPGTLNNWRIAGTGPAYEQLSSRLIRYRRSALDAFRAARTRRSTSEAA